MYICVVCILLVDIYIYYQLLFMAVVMLSTKCAQMDLTEFEIANSEKKAVKNGYWNAKCANYTIKWPILLLDSFYWYAWRCLNLLFVFHYWQINTNALHTHRHEDREFRIVRTIDIYAVIIFVKLHHWRYYALAHFHSVYYARSRTESIDFTKRPAIKSLGQKFIVVAF